MFQETIEIRGEERNCDDEMLVESKEKWLVLSLDHRMILKEAYLKAWK